MIIEFDKVYKELICEEVPMRKLRSVEDRGGHINKNEKCVIHGMEKSRMLKTDSLKSIVWSIDDESKTGNCLRN